MVTNLVTYSYSFILLGMFLLVRDTKGEYKKMCLENLNTVTSTVSFTQYRRVSESEWDEYVKNITEENPGVRLNLKQGLIPITHYSYNIGHPPQKIVEFSCKNDVLNKLTESETNNSINLCDGNRDGMKCELCKPNFFKNTDGDCILCQCSENGSLSSQCSDDGQCQCKPGIRRNNCDIFTDNFFDFKQKGCTDSECTCNKAGSDPIKSVYQPDNGVCQCKIHAEGFQCEKCKPGYFNLNQDNEFGCIPCFCNGHSNVCNSAEGYGQVVIESTFARGTESWSAQDQLKRSIHVQYSAFTQNLKINASDTEYELTEPIYFFAPARFLGDQKGSYNQELSFTLRINDELDRDAISEEDVILQGAAGLKVSQRILGINNSTSQEFSFKLNEHPKFGWTPTLSSHEFILLLSNLTSIKIRGAYSTNGVGFLDNVKLKTARRGASGVSAAWVETCSCPKGYIGQFCESCDIGYFRVSEDGRPLGKCIPCICNNHAKTCDQEIGHCLCEDNTIGLQCEKCLDGFYGNPLNGTSDDCKPCPCTDQGSCLQISDENVACVPKHASSIIFPTVILAHREVPDQIITGSHGSISLLTTEEIDNLPEIEFVKQVYIPRIGISDRIRK